jgi:hypothetical protein
MNTQTLVSTPHPMRPDSPVILLGLIPYLLGFVPDSSLVIIGTELTGQVKVTLRYDLPDPADGDVAVDLCEHAIAVLSQQRLTMAAAAGYGPGHLVTPLAEALREAATRAGIELDELLRVEDGRFWSYTCTGHACCPAEGAPFDPADHPLSAAMARCALPALSSRQALAATIAPLTGNQADTMCQATRRAEQRIAQAHTTSSERPVNARAAIIQEGLAAVAGMIATYRHGGKYRSADQLAWLTVVLGELRVRDDAWARMDPEYAPEHLRLLTDVVRRAQPGYVAPAASLLAFVAWQCGNGALANVALDRALADRPGYSMAELLRQVITAGMPPSMATLPLTPEQVAEAYATDDADDDADTAESASRADASTTERTSASTAA